MKGMFDKTLENFRGVMSSSTCLKCGGMANCYPRFSNKDDVVIVVCETCGVKFQIVKEGSNVRNIVDTKDPSDVVRVMSDFVNNYNCNSKEFVKLMSQEHRTLQQSFTKLCLEWFQSLAFCERFDDRNKASVEVSKKIVECLGGDINLPFI